MWAFSNMNSQSDEYNNYTPNGYSNRHLQSLRQCAPCVEEGNSVRHLFALHHSGKECS